MHFSKQIGRFSSIRQKSAKSQLAERTLTPESQARKEQRGCFDSVIGVKKEISIQKFLTKRPMRLAEQCGSSMYRCPGTCCYSTSRGYYCADSNGYC